MSTDEGANWTDITGDLSSNFSILDIRSIGFVRAGAKGGVVVGTNQGLYVARDTDYTKWLKVGAGLPNAPVWDLVYDATDDVLVAGTLGRGAWKMVNAAGNVLGLSSPTDDTMFFQIIAPDGKISVIAL